MESSYPDSDQNVFKVHYVKGSIKSPLLNILDLCAIPMTN